MLIIINLILQTIMRYFVCYMYLLNTGTPYSVSFRFIVIMMLKR